MFFDSVQVPNWWSRPCAGFATNGGGAVISKPLATVRGRKSKLQNKNYLGRD